jgi:ADP-ribose pyrophosphatase
VPLEGFVIETVAGMMDGGHNETREEVAHRELKEEAGCEAASMDPVLSWPYRSGSASGHCHGFIATGVHRINEAIAGDAVEDIQVFEVPFGGFWDFYRTLPDDTLIGSEVLALYAVAASRKR